MTETAVKFRYLDHPASLDSQKLSL